MIIGAIAALLFSADVFAAEISFDECEAQSDVVCVGVSGAGGWNSAWGGYGGADVLASVRCNSKLDCAVALEGLSANVWTVGATVQPRIDFGKGSLVFGVTLLDKVVARNRMSDFSAALRVGWKMKHFNIHLGYSFRMFDPFANSASESHIATVSSPSAGAVAIESANLIYRLQLNVMGDSASWDIFGGITDYTPFEIERMWSPILYLGGRLDINRLISIGCVAEYKAAGIFHQAAASSGVVCRAGMIFSF